jgi:putative Holliday junction resolvase
VRAFAEELAPLVLPVAVRLVDERLSTMTAESHLRASGMAGRKQSGKKRAVIDQAAATVILQAALDAERTRNEPPGEGIS